MNHSQLRDRFNQHWLRCDQIVYIAANVLCSAETDQQPLPTGSLLDALESDGDRIAVAAGLPEPPDPDDGLEPDLLTQQLIDAGRLGFLGQFALAHQRADGSRSWGIAQLQWFYADAIEDLISQADIWAQAKLYSLESTLE